MDRIVEIDVIVVEAGMLDLEGGVLVAIDAFVAEAGRSGRQDKGEDEKRQKPLGIHDRSLSGKHDHWERLTYSSTFARYENVNPNPRVQVPD
jgi:hypothetical protein